jgi:hypothetical protein
VCACVVAACDLTAACQLSFPHNVPAALRVVLAACARGVASPAVHLLFERMPLETVDNATAAHLVAVIAAALPLPEQYIAPVTTLAIRLLRIRPAPPTLWVVCGVRCVRECLDSGSHRRPR